MVTCPPDAGGDGTTRYRSQLDPDCQQLHDLEELIETRRAVLVMKNIASRITHSGGIMLLGKNCGWDRMDAFAGDMAQIFELADRWFGELDNALETERQSTEYGFYIPPCLDTIIDAGLERMTPEEKDSALRAVKEEIETSIEKDMRYPLQLNAIQKILHEDHLRRNREESA